MKKMYAISVKTNRGTWGSRNPQRANSVEEYMEMVKDTIAFLNRFNDTWRIIYLPEDHNLPTEVVYTPKSS